MSLERVNYDAIMDAVYRAAMEIKGSDLTVDDELLLEEIGRKLENALGLNDKGIRRCADYHLAPPAPPRSGRSRDH